MTFLAPRLALSRLRPLSFGVALLVLSACKEQAPAANHLAATRQPLDETQVPPSQTAQFYGPTGGVAITEGVPPLVMDYLLVPDQLNHALRRVEVNTGFVSTVAGNLGSVAGAQLGLVRPTAVDIESGLDVGRGVFVTDAGSHTLLHFVQEGQPLHVVAGTPGQPGYSAAGAGKFNAPEGVSFGEIINGTETVFVADTGNSVIRRVVLNPSHDPIVATRVELVAGVPGQAGFANAALGTQAQFNRPTGIAYDAHNKKLYVADTGNQVLRRVDLSTSANAVSTIAGVPGQYGYRDGALGQALFAQPVSVTINAGSLLVADRASYTIRAVDIDPSRSSPQVTTVAGVPWSKGSTDGDATQAHFRAPGGVATLKGVTFVVDTGNNLVRTIKPGTSGNGVSTLTGQSKPGAADGTPVAWPGIGQPNAIACNGSRLYINGSGLQEIALDEGASSGQVRLVSSEQWQTLTYFNGTVLHPLSYSLRTINVQTGAIGDVMTVDNESNTTSANACGSVLLVDENILDNGAWIDSTARFIAAANGGLVNPYPFNIQGITVGPGAVACSESGEAYYPALGSAALHHFDPTAANPTLSTLSVPGLGSIKSLTIAGGFAYYTETANGEGTPLHDIRRIDLTSGALDVVAGNATTPGSPFTAPDGLCVSGDNLFVADTGSGTIRRVNRSTGETVTLALRRAQ